MPTLNVKSLICENIIHGITADLIYCVRHLSYTYMHSHNYIKVHIKIHLCIQILHYSLLAGLQ